MNNQCKQCGKPLGGEEHIHTCPPTPQGISEQEAKYLFDNHLISEDNGEPATGWRKRKVQNVQRTS
jgi:hypothetical protein